MFKSWSKAGSVAAGSVLIALLCLMLLSSGLLQVLSNQLYDFNVRSTMSQEPHEDILVIGIDVPSIQQVGPYPWDRRVYAQLIGFLEEAGARVIAFDVEMLNDSPSAEGDRLLAEELAKHDNIIIPSHANLENRFDRYSSGRTAELMRAGSIIQPIQSIRASVQPAHINAAYDKDGVIRTHWMQLATPEGVFPSLALAAAQLADMPVQPYLNLPQLDGKPQSEMLIRWDAREFDFETISFVRVLRGDIPASVFKDRLVLVGYTAPGGDEGSTPVEKQMHLVYAHANILNQILKGQVVTLADKRTVLLLAVLVMLLFGLFTWRLRAITGLLTVLGVSLALFGAQYALFSGTLQHLDIVPAVSCGLVAYLGSLAMRTYFETKQKNYITKQFGRYVSPELVSEIAKSEREIELGGISKELSILFLDVRGFTALSEKLKPEEVVDFLNMMFNLITERAMANQGSIDKFIGDAAMILFNAPLDVPDHPYHAVKCAYEIQQGMLEVRREVLEKYGVSLSVGIGIHTGEVVVGNIGSYMRVDYTAIGDNVNIAARIESSSEPDQILVSEVTRELTRERFDYLFAGEKQMKGKSVPLRLFEVTGMHSGTTAEDSVPAGHAGEKVS